jgi:hypothetical protein
MADPNQAREEVDRFILDEIDTVPQLEALLLLWKTRPRWWKHDDLAAALYISADATREVIELLGKMGLVTRNNAGEYAYAAGTKDALIAAVAETYSRELVRISRMIHDKAPSAIRAFADAFRFKKGRE